MLEKRWDEQSVIREILAEHRAGNDLSYSGSLRRIPALLKAGERMFGNWKTAIMESGLNYDDIRKKRRWNKQQVIDRIIELYDAGEDLSWRNVSQKVDPALAAAVMHAGRFPSWEDALRAAGLKPQKISKYQHWNDKRIETELQKVIKKGHALTLPVLSKVNPPLLAAIYRRGMKISDIKEKEGFLIDKVILKLQKEQDSMRFADMMEDMMTEVSAEEMVNEGARELAAK
ncbi:MAG: hypothetical protein WCO98_14970 [bacterium]